MTLETLIEILLDTDLVSRRDIDAVLGSLGDSEVGESTERGGEQSDRGLVERFIKALVEQGKLTRFQARQVWSGRGQTLLLGNYVLDDLLGRGGGGVVYRAHHRIMRRPVAIKVIEPESLEGGSDARQRFQREVRTAAKLVHPNIVTAYDADQTDRALFLVMELVVGRDLATEVARLGPLPLEKAVSCITQAAEGLAYAHREGIVHRDIKPRNLLLSEQGDVKVLDLGLARVVDTQRRIEESLSIDASIENGLAGTADYMSPEQAESPRTVDGRADIYSLGCTLFFLLTGRPPFQREAWFDSLVAHQTAPIPLLSTFRDDLPETLQDVLNRMLAKSPADRYSSMAAVIEALRPFARDEEFEIHDPRDSGLEDLDYDTRVFDSSDLLDARPATTVGNLAQGEPTPRTGSLLSKRSSARKGEFTLAAFDVGTRGCVLAEAVGQRSENSTATIELPLISTLPHRDGSIQSPAAVFATDQRQILTGAEALNHFAADPRHGWLSPLSLLGHQGEMRSAYGLKPPAPLLVAILLEAA
ncbi:MAG: serine/threonine-protein kinase [Pirellulaceae bacterium]